MPKVTFEREELVVEARPGETLLDVADRSSVNVFRGMWPELHCGRMRGWCNRCKVWVKSDSPQAVNPPTPAERSPIRINGRVRGTMRLACQVEVRGDVEVHTRAGGPIVKQDVNWEADSAPTKWKERWEKRHEKGEKETDEKDA